MNAHKHMELIFGVVVIAGCVIADLPDSVGGKVAHSAAAAAAAAASAPALAPAPAAAAGIAVVVVKGKRLSALEKHVSGSALNGGADTTARDKGANGS